MFIFSPNTRAKSTEVNQNFTDLSEGTADVDNNKMGLLRQETMVDFCFSGLIWTIASGLNGTMTAGIAYISNGTLRPRVSVASIASRAFTASKDTYVDIDSTGTVYYSEVANGAGAPTLTANRMRVAKVVTNGSAITSIVQNSFESLGNVFRNTDPYGYTIVYFPTLQNGWVIFGAPWATPCYFKDKTGTVYLRGLIKSGTVGAGVAMFTLPTGFRPYTNQQVRFPVVSNNAFGVVNALSTGVVDLEVGSNNYVFLDGVRFKAEI